MIPESVGNVIGLNGGKGGDDGGDKGGKLGGGDDKVTLPM